RAEDLAELLAVRDVLDLARGDLAGAPAAVVAERLAVRIAPRVRRARERRGGVDACVGSGARFGPAPALVPGRRLGPAVVRGHAGRPVDRHRIIPRTPPNEPRKRKDKKRKAPSVSHGEPPRRRASPSVPLGNAGPARVRRAFAWDTPPS